MAVLKYTLIILFLKYCVANTHDNTTCKGDHCEQKSILDLYEDVFGDTDNITDTKLHRVKRAGVLSDVLSISSYPFVVSITTAEPTQGMGVIVHTNWVLTRDALVMNYKTNPRNVKIKSGDVNVLTFGKIHHATRIALHPNVQQGPNFINIQALVKACPPFASGSVVTLPPPTQVWTVGQSLTLLRWQNNLAQLKEQTAAITSVTCFTATRNLCIENVPFLTYDMGVPAVTSPGKVLVGIGTRRSLGPGSTQEGFENTAFYLTSWINPILLT